MKYAHRPPVKDVAVEPKGLPALGPQPPALPPWAMDGTYWRRLELAWLRAGYGLGRDGRLEYLA